MNKSFNFSSYFFFRFLSNLYSVFKNKKFPVHCLKSCVYKINNVFFFFSIFLVLVFKLDLCLFIHIYPWLYLTQLYVLISLFTIDTERPCPSFITPSVTLTSHVITCSTFSAMSWALSATVDTVPPISTFWSFGQHTINIKFTNNN